MGSAEEGVKLRNEKAAQRVSLEGNFFTFPHEGKLTSSHFLAPQKMSWADFSQIPWNRVKVRSKSLEIMCFERCKEYPDSVASQIYRMRPGKGKDGRIPSEWGRVAQNSLITYVSQGDMDSQDLSGASNRLRWQRVSQDSLLSIFPIDSERAKGRWNQAGQRERGNSHHRRAKGGGSLPKTCCCWRELVLSYRPALFLFGLTLRCAWPWAKDTRVWSNLTRAMGIIPWGMNPHWESSARSTQYNIYNSLVQE